jgi:hypothetical protein
VRRVDDGSPDPRLERPVGAKAAPADRVGEPVLHGLERALPVADDRVRDQDEVPEALATERLDLAQTAVALHALLT